METYVRSGVFSCAFLLTLLIVPNINCQNIIPDVTCKDIGTDSELLKKIDNIQEQYNVDISKIGQTFTAEVAQMKREFNAEIEQLKKELDDTKNELNDTKIELNVTKNELSDTKNELNVTKNELSDTKNELNVTKNELSDTKNELNVTKNELNDTENKLNAVEINIEDLKKPVAFFSYLTNHFYVRSGNQTIVYDAVRTNKGDGYNVSNGVFTAPCDGVYVFSWTTLIPAHKFFRLEIVVAGSVYLGIRSDTEDVTDSDTNTGIIVAEVRAKDTVYIRSRSTGYGNGYLFYDADSYVSSFVGWKIN